MGRDRSGLLPAVEDSLSAIKGVDPALSVNAAGLTYFWDWSHGRRQYLDRLLDVVMADRTAAAHNDYFDGLTDHLSFSRSKRRP